MPETVNVLWRADDPLYTDLEKPPRYNCEVSPLTCSDRTTAARMVVRRLRELGEMRTRQWHKDTAVRWEDTAARLARAWDSVANAAAMETWGREYQITEYRISGIASDQFSNVHKDVLRKLSHRRTDARIIASIHRYIANNFGRYRA